MVDGPQVIVGSAMILFLEEGGKIIPVQIMRRVTRTARGGALVSPGIVGIIEVASK